MLRSEFEKLIGKEIDFKEYQIIEQSYITYDNLFKTHQDVAELYLKLGLPFFEKLNADSIAITSSVLAEKKKVEETLKLTQYEVRKLEEEKESLLEQQTDLNARLIAIKRLC